MIKIKKFIILIAIIIHAQLIQSDEDLLELTCTSETHCKQYAHSGINVSCIEEQCRCTSSNGENVKCQPANSKLSNFIGGSCPCTMPNADCSEQQNICLCISEFVPSADKRRCIPKKVALDGKCAESLQCQRADLNAICNDSKECKCAEYFINDEGVCISVLGNKSAAWNATQCVKVFGNNTRYSKKYKQCLCNDGYFASTDNKKCLKVSKYLENCTEHLQCIAGMGLGGVCTENSCNCSDKYFVEEKKGTDDAITSVCTPVVERGQYCRYDDDCYQRQLSESEQSMHCSYGECNCKDGYNSLNDGSCIQGSAAGIKSCRSFQLIFILFIVFNMF